ncbi:MAG: hypothetical protein U5K30_17415 [Acidimicrobiales bacterium]|nr:hypothetical protein [Acidimicrobiales bacterium]
MIGSTGRWPEVVNMWELEGWEGIALGFSLEGGGKAGYDPSLEKWWAHAADFRRGGVDRLVVPAPWNRTIEELCADGVRGVCYAHELVQVAPRACPRPARPGAANRARISSGSSGGSRWDRSARRWPTTTSAS